ncbi:MAG: tryptophan 7-halogenase, partial [Lentilitoribacter sp.]
AALSIKYLNPQLKVDVIYSSRKGHIMVGEGTTYSVLNMLHSKIGLDREEFAKRVKPTPKLGIRFLWGSRNIFDYTFEANPYNTYYTEEKIPLGFMCDDDEPLMNLTPASANMSMHRMSSKPNSQWPGSAALPAAYHFENHAFVEHLADSCRARGIQLHDMEVERVEQDEAGITQLCCNQGKSFKADLYVDASGFSGILMNKTLKEPVSSFKNHIFCDKAVVGGWSRSSSEPLKPYTTAETMNAGWCWQIEHRQQINRGYVFCSDFLSGEDAEAEFRLKNPKVEETRIIPFGAQRSKRAWVKNVVAIGNANGFVEPLEATNIHIICEYSIRLAELLSISKNPSEYIKKGFNDYVENRWQMIAEFLALHYRFNEKLDTPFWQFARNNTDLGDGQALVDYFQAVGPDAAGLRQMLRSNDMFGPAGYLAMLIGMNVSYKKEFQSAESSSAYLRLLKKKNIAMATQNQTADQWTALKI